MRRGFTLIELLVVIAIIAILAAILFPVFAKAREKARQSSCLSNIKQLSLGVMQYCQDYDERLPYARYGYDGAEHITWKRVIMPYVKNWNIFECPSKPGHWVSACAGSNWPSQGPNIAAISAIAYNYHIGNNSLGQVVVPAETVMVADIDNCHQFVNQLNWLPGWFATRHNNGGNWGFADGHAKWQNKQSMSGASGMLYPDHVDRGWLN
jgi:prepilin-type N-terminal cleavage/methylation domain-containing protein/prepilin-type processing-associated H-X9-DG protein